MGQPSKLRIERLCIDTQQNKIGITLSFNQPISLNSQMKPATDIFLSATELEKIIGLLRKDNK